MHKMSKWAWCKHIHLTILKLQTLQISLPHSLAFCNLLSQGIYSMYKKYKENYTKLIFEKTIWLTCVEKCTWWGLLEPCVSFFSDLCHMWPQYNTCAKKNFDVTEWAIYVKYPPANQCETIVDLIKSFLNNPIIPVIISRFKRY